jgi:ABC-type lipoprotein export system ATPase subunit
LLHCLAGLRVPDDGHVVVDGAVVSAMSARRRARFRLGHVGMVFQFGELLQELTVAENVALPLRLRGEPDGGRVVEVLASVGLADRAGAMPGQLSGGEVQRAAIARAVAGRPRLLLADEPTGALDEDLSQAVAELLVATARAAGAVLVVATHDPIVAGAIGSTVRLRRGKLEPA